MQLNQYKKELEENQNNIKQQNNQIKLIQTEIDNIMEPSYEPLTESYSLIQGISELQLRGLSNQINPTNEVKKIVYAVIHLMDET